MKRVDSVISLIYSMSKAEKKAFSVQMLKDKEEKDYLVIYDIITKSKQLDSKNVKGNFISAGLVVRLKSLFNICMKD